MKLACVSYLNALPLIQGLNPKEVDFFFRPPAQLKPYLSEVDAALLPILNYFEDPNLYLIPGLCIGCRGAVESVKLFTKKPIQEVSKIYLDEESRTSQNLLKVILKEKYGRDLRQIEFTNVIPHWMRDLHSCTRGDPGSEAGVTKLRHPREIGDPSSLGLKMDSHFHGNDGSEAALLIGDKAVINPPQTQYEYDLGTEWTEWQKLPFVFAAWMSQKNIGVHSAQVLQDSLKNSFKNIDLLVDRFADKWDKARLKYYFSKSINYVLGEEDLKGIARFFELLKPIQGFKHELNFQFVS